MGLSGEEKVLVRQGVGALQGCWGRALSACGGAAAFAGVLLETASFALPF